MFRFQLHELLFAYTGFALGVVLFAALVHNVRRNRLERQALRNIVRCRLCAFEFRDETGGEFPRCPRCGAVASRERLSTL
jgi:hypothetical protein